MCGEDFLVCFQATVTIEALLLVHIFANKDSSIKRKGKRKAEVE